MYGLEQAISTALTAHMGQKDKVGEPYILHPLRVMLSFKPYEVNERMVAVLHDVLEDSTMTVEDFIRIGVPNEIVHALLAMTHIEGESYEAYIARVKENALATTVKRHDIADNLSMERMIRLDDGTIRRLTLKYNKALAMLDE